MNKPVAWMALNELNGSYSTFTNDQKQRLLPHVSQCYGKWIPLYTHPVKEQELLDEIAHLKHLNRNWQISENILLLELEKLQDHPVKELTDEEIISTMVQFDVYSNDDQCLIEAGRAILRKAREK